MIANLEEINFLKNNNSDFIEVKDDLAKTLDTAYYLTGKGTIILIAYFFFMILPYVISDGRNMFMFIPSYIFAVFIGAPVVGFINAYSVGIKFTYSLYKKYEIFSYKDDLLILSLKEKYRTS